VVWTSIYGCIPDDYHYASLSFLFYNHGEVYQGGHFVWSTRLISCV
jgi:hypothetical protein